MRKWITIRWSRWDFKACDLTGVWGRSSTTTHHPHCCQNTSQKSAPCLQRFTRSYPFGLGNNIWIGLARELLRLIFDWHLFKTSADCKSFECYILSPMGCEREWKHRNWNGECCYVFNLNGPNSQVRCWNVRRVTVQHGRGAASNSLCYHRADVDLW